MQDFKFLVPMQIPFELQSEASHMVPVTEKARIHCHIDYYQSY